VGDDEGGGEGTESGARDVSGELGEEKKKKKARRTMRKKAGKRQAEFKAGM
jgi:hypothetical protein